jgi:hypothetical protein
MQRLQDQCNIVFSFIRNMVLRLKSLSLVRKKPDELLKAADDAWKEFLDKEARKPDLPVARTII